MSKTYNLADLRKLNKLDNKAVASVMVTLAMLEVGDKISTQYGTLIKTAENSFSIKVTNANVSNLVMELTHEDNSNVYL